MIKFVDMTATMRAVDPQAPPTCAFVNTETGRFCEHGGSGEHLFTSTADVTQHGPPVPVDVPVGFWAVQWVDVPPLSLVLCTNDSDIAVKHADGKLEWVRTGSCGEDGGRWWPLTSPDFDFICAKRLYGWAVLASGLHGDETIAELKALAGVPA